MNGKQIAMLVALLLAAVAIGKWRYGVYTEQRAAIPLTTRLTFDYTGPVAGLFEQLATRSGAHYRVDPALAGRSVSGSFKNESVIEVQEFAAKAARLRYSPPAPGSNAIRVDPR